MLINSIIIAMICVSCSCHRGQDPGPGMAALNAVFHDSLVVHRACVYETDTSTTMTGHGFSICTKYMESIDTHFLSRYQRFAADMPALVKNYAASNGDSHFDTTSFTVSCIPFSTNCIESDGTDQIRVTRPLFDQDKRHSFVEIEFSSFGRHAGYTFFLSKRDTTWQVYDRLLRWQE